MRARLESLKKPPYSTGIPGFFLHLNSLLTDFSFTNLWSIVYGAPLFAPLLFTNLAILGWIGRSEETGLHEGTSFENS